LERTVRSGTRLLISFPKGPSPLPETPWQAAQFASYSRLPISIFSAAAKAPGAPSIMATNMAVAIGKIRILHLLLCWQLH
jgi:hypothetical protein